MCKSKRHDHFYITLITIVTSIQINKIDDFFLFQNNNFLLDECENINGTKVKNGFCGFLSVFGVIIETVGLILKGLSLTYS